VLVAGVDDPDAVAAGFGAPLLLEHAATVTAARTISETAA
jgi:hypothetical protein